MCKDNPMDGIKVELPLEEVIRLKHGHEFDQIIVESLDKIDKKLDKVIESSEGRR